MRDESADVPRNIRRARLHNMLVYYKKRHNLHLVEALRQQLSTLPIGGILPDEPRACVAHCGGWHPVVRVPLQAPCCGAVLLVEDEDNA